MTQRPFPPDGHPAPKHVKRLRPKTYSVAVYLVVAVVVLQVLPARGRLQVRQVLRGRRQR